MRTGASFLMAVGALALAACEAAPPAEPAAEVAKPEVATLEVAELKQLIEQGKVLLVDVRRPDEFAESRIPGALNAPVETFDPAAIPMEEGRETILYCRSGRRSERAATMLAEKTGGKVRHLAGGIAGWEEAGEPVQAQPPQQ